MLEDHQNDRPSYRSGRSTDWIKIKIKNPGAPRQTKMLGFSVSKKSN
jgi:hypothetical protein